MTFSESRAVGLHFAEFHSNSSMDTQIALAGSYSLGAILETNNEPVGSTLDNKLDQLLLYRITTSGIDDMLAGGLTVLAGGLAPDMLIGSVKDDRIRGDGNSRSPGGVIGGDDLLFGGQGNDWLGGKGGNDLLFGGDGKDNLFGDNGDDLLFGGQDDDTLTGDDYSGGTGNDLFVLERGAGTDIITDFGNGDDKIWLRGIDFSEISITIYGNDSLIKLEQQSLAIVKGFTNLTADDFLVLPDIFAPVSVNFPSENQPLVGIIDTGFNQSNPDIDYSDITLGSDFIDGDSNPLITAEAGNEHGTAILGIVKAIQGNGIGIDGINDDAPVWLGRAIGSGQWAKSLTEFVDAAIASEQPNAVVNLSFDLTQTDSDGNVTTRYELTPEERIALEYARKNGVIVVVAAGNDSRTMSALGQASQEFENLITVGSVDYEGNRAEYSSFGHGLDVTAFGGTEAEPIASTVGDGSDLEALLGESDLPEDEMATSAQATFIDAFGELSEGLDDELDETTIASWTPEERQLYEESTQEIDQFLSEYLKAASEKLALEYADGQYQLQMEALEKFIGAVDGDLVDNLIKAQEIFNEAGQLLDLEAPDDDNFDIPFDFGVGTIAGTSVAAAKVTGAISQIWAANPNLSPIQVKEILKQTAIDVNTPGSDIETGAGVVNLEAAIERAQETEGEPYDPIPLSHPLTWSGEGEFIPSERAVNTPVPSFTGQILNIGYVDVVNFLRVRSGPGQQFTEVGKKFPGDSVTFDAYTDNGSFVADLFMPGGGSSRWYKIAGTNNWMSALYLDNSPEQAAEERQRQEAIRAAEEAVRRAEEEARRAEEEARRAEEELQKIEAEQRLQREQLQSAVDQATQKFGHLGLLLNSSISNGVRIYEFEKGQLYIQPDGRSFFYEATQQANIFFEEEIQPRINDALNPWKIPSKIYEKRDRIAKLGKHLAYEKLASPTPTNGFVTFRPRFGQYSQYVDESFSFLSKQVNNLDDFVTYKATSPSNRGFILPRFNSTRYSRFAKGKAPGIIGAALTILPTAYEVATTEDATRKREIIVESSLEAGGAALGGWVGGLAAGALGSVVPGAGTAAGLFVGSFVGGVVGGYLGKQAGQLVNNNWEHLESGFTAISDFGNSTVEAAKQRAQQAKQKAEELASQARATLQTAKAGLNQAAQTYQAFKQEVQQKTTQIVQRANQKLQESVQQVRQRVIQAVPKVARQVTHYAKQAFQTVNNVINGAKQFVDSMIDAGRRTVDNTVASVKKAYETTKTFVEDTYQAGKETVTQAVEQASETVNNAVNTVTKGFSSLRSRFGW